MAINNFLQINSQGSADPKNQELAANVAKAMAVGPTPEWDKSPNHPIVQSFQNLFSDPKHATMYDHPEIQNKLFDVDNLVKGQAGIYRTNQQGLNPFGSDIDGKPLYTMNDIANSKDFSLGKNRMYTIGSTVQQLGVFSNPEDSDHYAKITHLSGDPNFMGRVEGLNGQGNTKGAVNAIMTEFGHPELDNIKGSPDEKKSGALAFAAYNYAQNSEKMSPGQKSLAMSTMGMIAYKFKDGTTLGDKPIIKDSDGKTAFSTSDALALAGTGTDIYSLHKNWDQIDAMQRITYGKGTASQMAATGKRMGLLGDPSMGGAAASQTADKLGSSGFKAVPSAGIGAITGDGQALPQGYEVVGAGEKPGQVIAVPKGLSYSAATLNGSSEIRSLNAADGVKPASTGAFRVYGNQLPVKNIVSNVRGTSYAAGVGQSGINQDPYVMSAAATVSVHGNTIKKNDVTNIRRAGENAALNYATVGVSGKLQQADKTLTGGKGEALREKADDLNPMSGASDKLTAAVLNKGMSLGGGKGEAQKGREQIRAIGVNNGLIDKDTWSVTLADGSKADMGADGENGQHEFRNKDEAKSLGVDRPLNSYDVDFTNDLDFSSNMMTSALVRMMAGGKGTSIDQVSGQLANAALGNVGFGKDMTPENFAKVQANVRGFYFKKGIQTKEDAFALSNQMLNEGRITETDLTAMQQGINMAFDDHGYDTANIMMSGRRKGLEVAGDVPKSPGPNFEAVPAKPLSPADLTGAKPLTLDMSQAEDPEAGFLKFNSGSYGPVSNTDAFTKSVIKYKQAELFKSRRTS